MEAGRTYGTLEHFDPNGSTTFTRYVERAQLFFRANNITDDGRKRDIFLTLVGASVFDRAVDLLAPQSPAEVPLDDIINALKAHYDPAPSKRVQRYHFNNRTQGTAESIVEYIAELRRLAQHCQFGTQLEDMLCDRLIVGVRNDDLRRKLLAQPDTGFQRIQEIAIAHETAARDASAVTVSRDAASGEVHLVNRPSRPTRRAPDTVTTAPQLCAGCAGPHLRSECRFRNARCRVCQKLGHISTVCRAKTRRRRPDDEQGQPAEATASAHVVSDLDYSVFTLSGNGVQARRGAKEDLDSSPPIIVPITLNDRSTQMCVDTGADFSCITLSCFDNLWPTKPTPRLEPFTKQLKAYTGQSVFVVGKVKVTVTLAGRSAVLPLLVVDTSGPNLLGRNWMKSLHYSIPQLHAMSVSDVETNDIKQITRDFPALFSPELGKFTGPPISIPVNENSQPVFRKARRVPFALCQRVGDELQRLVEQDILEPVRYSRWATPVVVVNKADGKLRLCGDYKVTVNRVAKADSYPLPRFEEILAALPNASHFSKLDMSQAYQQLVVDEAAQELLTINTHRGLFKVKRLAFGISAAPGLFQRVMKTVL